MNLLWSDAGWEDYLYWQVSDRKILDRVNRLIEECTRTPFGGTGKPEPLRAPLSGWWSRRITIEHRLVYRPSDGGLLIAQCRSHD